MTKTVRAHARNITRVCVRACARTQKVLVKLFQKLACNQMSTRTQLLEFIEETLRVHECVLDAKDKTILTRLKNKFGAVPQAQYERIDGEYLRDNDDDNVTKEEKSKYWYSWDVDGLACTLVTYAERMFLYYNGRWTKLRTVPFHFKQRKRTGKLVDMTIVVYGTMSVKRRMSSERDWMSTEECMDEETRGVRAMNNETCVEHLSPSTLDNHRLVFVLRECVYHNKTCTHRESLQIRLGTARTLVEHTRAKEILPLHYTSTTPCFSIVYVPFMTYMQRHAVLCTVPKSLYRIPLKGRVRAPLDGATYE